MTQKSSMRLDIQALRAIAVTAVVVFHVWPDALPGGFIGVDVFFVISGFLITQHLMKERDATGTIQLGRFWARRARRLLPAAFTVLAVTAVTAWLFLPLVRLDGLGRHVAGAALYVENWLLATDSVDYLAAAEPPGPVQHFWSLSVEEQFYLVWPVLIVVAGLLAKRHSRRAITVVMALLVVGSFGYSLMLTGSSPASAYFVTPTRAWEFGAGALLALAPRLHLGDRLRAVVAWIGFALIAVGSVWITGETPFPGTAALLPVVGAVLFMGAAANTAPYSPNFVGQWRPVQRLGDISYSVYLWHWPILVIVPFALPGVNPWVRSLLVVALTLALAEASFRWIETPTRQSQFVLRQPTWRTLTAALAGSLVVIAIAVPVSSTVKSQTAAARAQLEYVESQPGCVGAGGDMACLNGTDIVVVPDPQVDLDHGTTVCQQGETEFGLVTCDEGVPAADAEFTVAVIGDSHARQWAPALIEVANQRNWHLVFMLKASCPLSSALRDIHGSATMDSCTDWNKRVQEYIAEHPEISMVITSATSIGDIEARPSLGVTEDDWDAAEAAKEAFPASRGTSIESLAAGIEGARVAWEKLPDTVTSIVVLRDVPRPRTDLLDCLHTATDKLLAQGAPQCELSRSEALLPDPLAVAATLGEPRVRLVDLTEVFCTADTCRVIINGASVYRDQEHLTTIFAASVAEEIAAALS